VNHNNCRRVHPDHHRTLLGYTRVRGVSEYRVEHPRWKFLEAIQFEIQGRVALLYGDQFFNH